MQPPSDSINHQSHKLAEFVASLRSQNSLAPPQPPPTYAIATARTSLEDTLGEIVDDDDDDEESAAIVPIIIKIDTSINIEGQGNTIAIPTSMGASTSEEPPASIPTSKLHSTSLPAGGSSPLQQLQQQRQVKSAQLATAIISALKTSGIMDDKETGRQRPVEVNVSSGIRIKGDGNVVRAGVPKRSELSHVGNSDSSFDEKEELSGRWRKRRASSQPIEILSKKRQI
ncbi:conserved hypothetical protein [Histoplasma capsulatum var. duboisii H88]|uniref:Uncharacterized protein n=1 Tax=Ajellomyces capsulatus (strain H88) TaxID=544711 RepID=F0U4P0_AJEC8|nr:conserved hypothetical protein [Histoplasma capsulatum var. duboisii H88]QSS51585.1 hypothetical protein I7I53_06946 [Histoplasma capsulatum var. duboisii H88]